MPTLSPPTTPPTTKMNEIIQWEVNQCEAALRSEVARGGQCVYLQPRFIEETSTALKKKGYRVNPSYKELWIIDEFTSFRYSCMRLCQKPLDTIE